MSTQSSMNMGNLGLLNYLLSAPSRIGLYLEHEGFPHVVSAQECASELLSEQSHRETDPSKSTKADPLLTPTQLSELAVALENSGPEPLTFAVLSIPMAALTPEVLGLLQSRGIESLITRTAEGTWEKVSLQGSSWRLRWRAFVFLRKLCLKLFGRQLHEFGVNGYTLNEGHAYIAPLPQFNPISDGESATQNGFALFEESTPLFPHYPHNFVRELGHGRFSLWNGMLFFSATDNSDPNTNARRYRVLNLTGFGRLLKPFLALPSNYSVADYVADGQLPKPTFAPGSPTPLPVHEVTEAEITAALRAGGYGEENKKGRYTPGSITLLITNLGAGGAERQLSCLAIGLKRRGVDVNVISFEEFDPVTRHHLPLLQKEGVEVSFIPKIHRNFKVNNFTTPDGLALLNLLGSLPPEFGSLVTALYTHLVVRRPEVLHCWLDTANIVGGVAGLLAGVPRVILSSRSINPTNFPGLHRPWFLPWYRAIMASNRVRWIANSKHGALSYAEWIGFDPSLADHVPNGIDCAAFTSPSEAIIRDTRAKYGIEKDDCLIIGVMRFSQEKRPQRFVRLIHELRQMGKPVKGLLVGGGSLEDLVRWEVKNLGLENILHLVGIKSDIQTFMSASDILVLTSDFEGFPNVLIEGKVMGKPVVATAVGGACDIIRSGIDGYLCNPNVFAELRERVAQLVDDPSLRAQMGKEGLSHAYETFNSDRMVDRMLSCYGIPGKAVGDESEMRFARAGNLV